MQIQVTKSTSATFSRSLSLAELRQFVAACNGLSSSARVTVTKYDSRDQRESSTITITVNDA